MRQKLSSQLIFVLLMLAVLPSLGQKPNIILIITDDQSFNSIGYTGGEVMTPCIDSLAGSGMKFTNAHHPTSTCSPSRYAMLTGKFPGRCETESFMAAFPAGTPTRVENNIELTLGEPHLGNILHDNGYTTGFVGKSHIMDHDILRTANWESFGLQTYGQTDDPYDPAVSAKMKHNHEVYQEIVRSYGFDYADGIYMANVRELHNDALNIHNLEWTVDKARKFIEQEKDNPFFLYFSTTLHHGPVPWSYSNGEYWAGLDADPKLTGEGLVDTTWNFMPTREEIKAKVTQHGYDANTGYTLLLDEGVRAIYKQVVDMGIEENTLIVFMPDHGMWRHGKATLYDFGTKVPMFMYWKGRIVEGSIHSGLVQSVDFAPTFLDIANATFSGDSVFDGTSLKSIMESGTGTAHESLFADFGYARSVKTDKWKYIAVRYPDDVQSQIDAGFTWTGYDGGEINFPYLCGNSHLGHYASENNPLYFETDQLFDLESDSAETVNVMDQNPDVVATMKELLSGYLKDFENRPFGEFTLEATDLPLRANYPLPRSTRDDVTAKNVILSWKSGGGALSHDVYFGTTENPQFIGNQTENTYVSGDLEPLTTYYWRIDEVNANGKTTGNLWSFTTQTDKLFLPVEKFIYADVAENEIRDQQFSIVNVKEQDVTINAISIGGTDASFFEVSEDEISGTTLSHNAQKSFEVRYQPGTSGGNHWAYIVIASDLGNDTIELISEDVSSIYRVTIDGFDEMGGWTSNNALGINNKTHKEGGACLEIFGKETREYQLKLNTPIKTLATIDNAYLQFWYYVSDVSKYLSNNQVEFGSGGGNDKDEFNWNLNGKLSDGWNLVKLKFSEAGITPTGGNPDLGSINHIRIYHGKTDNITVRIDGMQVIDSTVATPEIATHPQPDNGAIGIPKEADLSWTAGERTLYHYVYFSSENPPEFVEQVNSSSYNLPELASNTTYYWRIDEMNEAGVTQGDVWSFTTLKETSGLQSPKDNIESFELMPNPSNGKIKLILPSIEETAYCQVLDLNGRTVAQYYLKQKTNEIDLTMMNKGIYFVRVGYSKTISTKKIVIK